MQEDLNRIQNPIPGKIAIFAVDASTSNAVTMMAVEYDQKHVNEQNL